MWTRHEISSTFWSPSIWLPKNTTWADVAPGSRPNINYADCRDLLWSIPLAVALFTIRYCSEKYIFSTIGQSLGIKSKPSSQRPTPNRILEMAYKECNHRLDDRTVIGLTKQVDTMTQREIERWWRLRRAQDKPTPIRKFCESSWNCLYYTYSFSLGLFVLWDKPWLWDFEQCTQDYPLHSLDSGTWLYIMVTLSLHLTLIVSQFFDVKRKDFYLMFAHHIATILAISLSWIVNFHRMGSLVLFYHDFSHIFLEAAKIAKYAKYHKLCDAILGMFVLAWTISRLVLYPQVVWACTALVLYSGRATMVPIILLGLLILLQCMHILWSYMIFQIAFGALKAGRVEKDSRSSSDSDDDGGSELSSHRENNRNGAKCINNEF